MRLLIPDVCNYVINFFITVSFFVVTDRRKEKCKCLQIWPRCKRDYFQFWANNTVYLSESWCA